MKRTGRQMKGSGRQASQGPDHKHPAWETYEKHWETNEKKWETNESKWETSQPGSQCFKAMVSLGDWTPTCFHLSPSSFHLSHLETKAVASVVGFPAGLSPTCFHLSPSSFHLSPTLGDKCLPLGDKCLPGWETRQPGARLASRQLAGRQMKRIGRHLSPRTWRQASREP